MKVAAAEGPPLWAVAPFFLVAPLGLLTAGLLFASAGDDALLAINAPRNVAATHAAVLGWLTLSIMGAVYQLGPAVLGGRLRSVRLVAVQLVLHVVSIAGFIAALSEWSVTWMSFAGVGIVVSFILFLVNAIPGVAFFRRGSLTRTYVSVALLFLIATASVGVTYLGTLEHLWFPVTLGRLSGHAHLGLVGWLALMIMGVSYQLVPMFNVVQARAPRFGWLALAVTTVSTAVAATWLMSDPAPAVRVALALLLAVGPGIWAIDILRLLLGRSRRTLDVQGRASFLSLAFLAAAIVAGILVAIGEPVAPGGEPARLQLAYGAIAIGGWAGLTLIGNSYKILPFLVWYHRYRQFAGSQPVPLVADLVNNRWAHITLAVHAAAVLVLAAGAIAGVLLFIHIAGAILALSGALHFATLAAVVFRRRLRALQATTSRGFAFP